MQVKKIKRMLVGKSTINNAKMYVDIYNYHYSTVAEL